MVVHRVGVAVGGGLLARQAQRATDLHLCVLLKKVSLIPFAKSNAFG